MNRKEQYESLPLCAFRCIPSEKVRSLSSLRKLLRGQPIGNRARCSSLLYSGTFVLVVCTSSKYLCLPYIFVLVSFVGSFVLSVFGRLMIKEVIF